MRDRLIELILNFENELDKKHPHTGTMDRIEATADHLIANGVIVPPCKKGDTVYVLITSQNYISEDVVTGFVFGKNNDTMQFADGSIYTIWDKAYSEHFGKTVFLSREDAERTLEEMQNNGGS